MTCRNRIIGFAVLTGIVFSLLTASSVVAHPKQGASAQAVRGTGCAHSIVIRATDEFAGVAAENRWLARHYPDARLVRQSLSSCGKTPTDIMRMQAPDGREFDVYFDSSHFFAKE